MFYFCHKYVVSRICVKSNLGQEYSKVTFNGFLKFNLTITRREENHDLREYLEDPWTLPPVHTFTRNIMEKRPKLNVKYVAHVSNTKRTLSILI